MEPTYWLRDGALDLFTNGSPKWRSREGGPHQTNIAFAAGITPSIMSKTVRRQIPVSVKFQASLVSLAINHLGMTEEQARAALFEFVDARPLAVA